jgi:electron transport complex protein RnfA
VWFLNRFVLEGAPYLRTIAFIVVIASLVQIVEIGIKKASPKLFRELGIYLPLITTNCAILALAVMQTSRGYGLLQGVCFALGAGLGLTLALVLMASIRERQDLSTPPDLSKGTALVLVIAGCLSLAFMGFAGLFTAA